MCDDLEMTGMDKPKKRSIAVCENKATTDKYSRLLEKHEMLMERFKQMENEFEQRVKYAMEGLLFLGCKKEFKELLRQYFDIDLENTSLKIQVGDLNKKYEALEDKIRKESKKKEGVMKITMISKDEKTWLEDECSDGIEIYFGEELVFSAYDGCREDNNLSRNFKDCFKIPQIMKRAWEAGKKGEELIFDTRKVSDMEEIELE